MFGNWKGRQDQKKTEMKAFEIAKFFLSKFEEQRELKSKNLQMEEIGILKIQRTRQKV